MKNLLYLLSFLLIFIVPFSVMAQGAPPATPIDGGLSLLLAAGGIYGAKKIYDKREAVKKREIDRKIRQNF